MTSNLGSVDTGDTSPELEDLHRRIEALRADLALVDRQLRDTARAHPLLTIGVALAIGFALGRAIGRA